MGLDMYAFSATREQLANPEVLADLKCKPGEDATKVAYWRKFNALHAWMQELYRSKGGTDPEFNCNTVRLDAADLDALERKLDATKPGEEQGADALQPTGGFFFGHLTVYPEDLETTRTFIAKAREALAAGRVVFYDSWW